MKDMIKLVAYGDHPHAAGVQRLTPDSGRELARQFQSLRSRLARRFGGLPVYVGHPDDPAFAGTPGHADTRAHGWVEEVSARDDGLYVRVKWAGTGQELLDNAHYKFLSPRWAVKEVEPRLFVPIRLISVGLANQPNIAGDTIANEEEALRALLRRVAERLDLAPEVNAAALLGRLDEVLATEKDQAAGFYRLAVDAQDARADLEREVERLRLELDEERAARIELLLDQAQREGRIAVHNRAEWQATLANDLGAGLDGLQRRRAPLSLTTRTQGLAESKLALAPGRLLDRVHARMEATGEDFATAWRRSRC